ncbi:hypothetical protein C5167_045170, partial [Papaver somniferum]
CNVDALYSELWHACADPLVTLPRKGDLVFYFPQGHIEQVEASTNPVADQQMPVYDLPAKILFHVINVKLKAEADTDEQDENLMEKENVPQSSPHPLVHSFCKTLTASDTSTHGVNLEGICSKVVGVSLLAPKGLGENGELSVGVYRAMRQQGNIPSSVISSHSMHLGVLATAWHAILTGTMFIVYYKPRKSPKEFIIPYGQYMKSVKNIHSIGMRFKMRFEGEESPEQSMTAYFYQSSVFLMLIYFSFTTGLPFTCTIVGTGDADPNRWNGSNWRCLKVGWDETSSVPRLERVSPWKVEPSLSPPALNPLPVPRSKRPRTNMVPSSPDSSVLTREGYEESEFAKLMKGLRGQIGNLPQIEQEDRENVYASNNPIPVSGLGSSTNSQTTKRTTTTTNKKLKKETPPSVGAPVKVKKEKIGERIAALHN